MLLFVLVFFPPLPPFLPLLPLLLFPPFPFPPFAFPPLTIPFFPDFFADGPFPVFLAVAFFAPFLAWRLCLESGSRAKLNSAVPSSSSMDLLCLPPPNSPSQAWHSSTSVRNTFLIPAAQPPGMLSKSSKITDLKTLLPSKKRWLNLSGNYEQKF